MTTKVNSELLGNTEVHYFHLNSDIYGSTSSTAVRGNTSIQINTSGSLTGGGTLVLGAGGTLTISYTEPTTPSYSSVTVTNGGTLTGFSTTVSGTTPTTVANYSATTYGGAKIVILAIDQASGVRQATELLASNTTSSVVATQYATVSTTATIGTFELSIVSGNVNIVATGVSGNTVIYKVSITLLPN